MTEDQARKYAEKWIRGKAVYEGRYGTLDNAMSLEGFTSTDIDLVKRILSEIEGSV
jgi:hypothetical protein